MAVLTRRDGQLVRWRWADGLVLQQYSGDSERRDGRGWVKLSRNTSAVITEVQDSQSETSQERNSAIS